MPGMYRRAITIWRALPSARSNAIKFAARGHRRGRCRFGLGLERGSQQWFFAGAQNRGAGKTVVTIRPRRSILTQVGRGFIGADTDLRQADVAGG